jgi:hypothetical protein
MSNQTGDRYMCSNATCGCEIEVKRPAAGAESTGVTSGRRSVRLDDDLAKSDTIMDVAYVRPEDADLPRPRSGPGQENERRANELPVPRCFCGSPMQEVGEGVVKTRVASVKL